MNTMVVDVKNLPPGDPKLIESIVNHFKSQGIFDQFRKDCLADVDTKPAYQNLRQRVDGNASKFLNSMQWRADLNKNQLRDSVRRQIHESGMLNIGVDRIVDQVVNPKIYQVFMPKITEVVHQFLGIKDGSVDLPSQIKPELDVVDKPVDKPKELPVLEPSNTPPHSPKTFSSSKTESIRCEANTSISTVPCNTGYLNSNPSTSVKVECVVPSDNRDAASTTPRSDFPTPEAAIQEMNEDTIKLEIKKALEALMETSAAVKGDDEAALRRSKLNISSSSDAVTPEKKKESKLWEAVKQVSGSETKPKTVDTVKKDPETGKAKKSESTPVKPVEMAPKPKLEKTKSDPVKKLEKESDKAVSKVKQLERKDSKAKCGESATKPKLKEHKVDKPKSSEAPTKSEKSPDGKKIIHKPKPVETPVVKPSASTDKKKDIKPKDDKPVKTDAAKKIVKSVSNSGASKDTKTKSVESTTTKHGNVAKPAVKVKPPDTADGKKSDVKSEAKSTQKPQKESTSKKVSGEEVKQKHQKEVVKQKHVPQVKEVEKAKVTNKPEDKTKVDKDKKEGKEKPVTHKECEVRLVKLEDRDPSKKPHPEEKIKVLLPEVVPEEKLDDLSPPPLPPVCEGKPEESDDVDMPVLEEVGSKRKHPSTVVAVNRKSSRDTGYVDPLIGFAAVREYSDGGYAVARKKRRIKNAESSEEEREDEDDAQSVGVLSDVTVSSVHTSDLSDFDDHISLTDAEEENAKKNEDPATAGDGKPKKRGRGRPRRHRANDQPSDNTTAEKDPSFESEPRRELRRQRRLNPKYASDDFSSIFNKHKGRGAGIFHGDHTDRAQPDGPRGSVSTQGDRKRTARGQVSSPSDSGEASTRLHGENLEMDNKDTKQRRSSSCSGSSSPPAKKVRRDRSGSLPDGGNVAIGVQKETRHKSTGNITRRKTAS